MNPSSEFSIESKPCSFSFLLKSLGDELDKTHKLQDFISRLEEERLKIDAFKRELPLCMQLLNDAMEASRQQLAACNLANHNPRPVLEEFIPLKHQETSERSLITSSVEATAASAAGTGSWMATTQIWSQSNDGSRNQGPEVSIEPEHGLIGSSKLALDAKQRVGGAFLPFSKERNGATQQALRSQLPDLALAPSDKNGADEPKRPEAVELAVPISRIKAIDQSNLSQGNCNGAGGVVGGGSTEKNGGNEMQAAGGGQTHRKPRRCWSPDLHRRFVNALQQLGGSQAATPKQIRELMKVDGLTNDEVKSHLQKYRLHTRRPSPTPQAVATPAPQLVVLGGIWVPPEYTTAAHTAAPGIYSATIAAAAAAQAAPPTPPPPPTHYCHPSPLPQDFCTQLSTPPHHQLRHVYCDQQLTAANHNSSKYNSNGGDKDKNNNSNSSSQGNNNKTSSNSRSSLRSSTAGERSQTVEEEGRSESGSWRGESTENEGGREMGRALSLKRRATLRSEEEEEDREESTGSDITLKF